MTAKPPLSAEAHEEITRMAVWAGQLLLQHGAETTLVESAIHRLGCALGCDWVDAAITANAIVITTTSNERFVTKARRVVDRGIDMRRVSDVERLCVMAEKKIIDLAEVRRRLRFISDRARPYNRYLVVVMIGLSCAAFSRLAGGDWPVFAITFIASAVAMLVRQEIAHKHFSPLINFTVAAAVATSIAALAPAFSLGDKPQLAMVASVLLLVPGFPFMNAISDMVKGHVNVGLARWTFALLLSTCVALGILLAMNLTGVWGWI